MGYVFSLIGVSLVFVSVVGAQAEDVTGKFPCDDQQNLIYKNLRGTSVPVRVRIGNTCTGSGHDVSVLQRSAGKPLDTLVDVPPGDTVRVDIDVPPSADILVRMKGSLVTGQSYTYSVGTSP